MAKERIDNIEYRDPELDSTAENKETLFLTGPEEFLCFEIAEALKADPVWKKLFGDLIDPYKRMDYPERSLPALRIYTNSYTKSFESWFIEGDVIMDLIFPANIRRRETAQIPSTVAAALLQQFRRRPFFRALGEKVPGLNELGKRFDVDNSLAFEWADNLVPLTQINANFRIDLRQWDIYAESDDRTKDDPFERTLRNLEKISGTIQGMRDDDTTVEVNEVAEIKIENE